VKLDLEGFDGRVELEVTLLLKLKDVAISTYTKQTVRLDASLTSEIRLSEF
jgi:hypothetical protein